MRRLPMDKAPELLPTVTRHSTRRHNPLDAQGTGAMHPLPHTVSERNPALEGGSVRTVAPALADPLDRSLHAGMARITGGLSPAPLALAFIDWATHLAAAPGRGLQLAKAAMLASIRLADYARHCGAGGDPSARCIEPQPHDHRFRAPGWQQFPFNVVHQAFLLHEQWWHQATIGLRGVSSHHQAVVEFAARQMLDMAAPSNFLWTNPEVLERTIRDGGINLVKGAGNLIDDWRRAARGDRPAGSENFEVGGNIAVTPGEVVWRNDLIELIRYRAATAKVRSEPILIVPAWIMKYYILDLSPHNSLVRYLTEQGYNVFMISWKNPGGADRDVGMEDYRIKGFAAALDEVGARQPSAGVHAAGYCLGGTLLAIAAAAMARDGDRRLKSLTLFASQVDFTESGELTLFIDEGQIAFLEDLMLDQGYLDSRQMAGAFELLRSNDLIWSRLVHNYLMGEREPMSDLMAWNADATRMPYRMHSQYLRRLFLDNDLAEGRYVAAGRPVALSDIHTPMFAVGTLQDHVAPWRSTYKIHLLTDAEVTFVLTTGGHNAGIVSEPGHKGRSYQVMTRPADGRYLDPDAFLATAPRRDGSWWPAWTAWLDARSGAPIDAGEIGDRAAGAAPCLGPAPGTYVLQG
jgi:polyhydroxyalkanoate synthase subunit PhaC